VERGTTRLLLGKQGAVLLGEMFEELIVPIGNRCSEVSSIRQLEVQYRLGVVNAQPL